MHKHITFNSTYLNSQPVVQSFAALLVSFPHQPVEGLQDVWSPLASSYPLVSYFHKKEILGYTPQICSCKLDAKQDIWCSVSVSQLILPERLFCFLKAYHSMVESHQDRLLLGPWLIIWHWQIIVWILTFKILCSVRSLDSQLCKFGSTGIEQVNAWPDSDLTCTLDTPEHTLDYLFESNVWTQNVACDLLWQNRNKSHLTNVPFYLYGSCNQRLIDAMHSGWRD